MNMQVARGNSIGFVVIGRNEGDRLKVGLKAIKKLSASSEVVYVDSGSSDDSVEFARSLGINVVELDLSIPFTAARARNAGFEVLIQRNAELKYVQFMDGDCELLPGWVEAAVEALEKDDNKGIVSGRRKERYPEASVYNTLMDIEWNTPIGETKAVLGDMCIKVSVFKEIGGFSEGIIAAEDDDICLRSRLAGFTTYRLDAAMSVHDANIMLLSQWFKRAKRGGHGYANIYNIHGKGPDKHFRRELMRAAFWGGLVPASFLFFLIIKPSAAILVLFVYLMFIIKLVVRRLNMGDSLKIACIYSILIYTSKIAELLGVVEYWKNRLLSRKHQLIEYK